MFISFYSPLPTFSPPPPILTLLSVFCACGITIMGSSNSVVSTVSLFPRVNTVDLFLYVLLLENRPPGGSDNVMRILMNWLYLF